MTLPEADSAPIPGEPSADSGGGPDGPGRHPGRGTGTRLWLVRHGLVDAAYQGVAYGDMDVPLSPEGLEQTERVARRLGTEPLAAILSSPLQRALRLAERLAELTGVALEVEPDLREIHRGTWQGRAVSELHASEPEAVAAFHADPWNWREHQGESDRQILERVWPVVERVLDEHAGRTAALVAHYNVIRVAATYALGLPPVTSFGLRVDTGRAVLLEDGERGWILHQANVTGPVGRGSAE